MERFGQDVLTDGAFHHEPAGADRHRRRGGSYLPERSRRRTAHPTRLHTDPGNLPAPGTPLREPGDRTRDRRRSLHTTPLTRCVVCMLVFEVAYNFCEHRHARHQCTEYHDHAGNQHPRHVFFCSARGRVHVEAARRHVVSGWSVDIDTKLD